MWDNLDVLSQHYAMRAKQHTNRKVLHGFTYMWNLIKAECTEAEQNRGYQEQIL